MDSIAQHIQQAHGGAELWRSIQVIELEMAAWGFLFTAKRIPARPRQRLSVAVARMEVTLHDYPVPGHRAVLLPDSTVQWWDEQNRLLLERQSPRAEFHRLRRQLLWDELDFAYFCGYAMWNYVTMPSLLARPDVHLTPTADKRGDGAGHTLHVEFGPTVVTHSRHQTFHFDPQWRLVRHDYTAEVVGSWAQAAHMCSEYRTFDGLPMPTRRRVLPTLLGHVRLPGPTLVGLDIHGAVLKR